MDKFFTYVFAILGMVALGCALFAGATHQLFVAGICGIMYLVGRQDLKKNKPVKSTGIDLKQCESCSNNTGASATHQKFFKSLEHGDELA